MWFVWLLLFGCLAALLSYPVRWWLSARRAAALDRSPLGRLLARHMTSRETWEGYVDYHSRRGRPTDRDSLR